jgi:hypothetical protein
LKELYLVFVRSGTTFFAALNSHHLSVMVLKTIEKQKTPVGIGTLKALAASLVNRYLLWLTNMNKY